MKLTIFLVWKYIFHWTKNQIKTFTKPSVRKIVIGAFSDITRTRADFIAENALLRQQLIIIKRQIKRPQLTNRDRLSLVLLAGQSPRLHHTSDASRALLTGLIWGVGNYGMLLLVDTLGAGRGFTIAQLSIVVNALVGIYWLKDPQPRSRADWLTLTGCALATFGGIILGNLK